MLQCAILVILLVAALSVSHGTEWFLSSFSVPMSDELYETTDDWAVSDLISPA